MREDWRELAAIGVSDDSAGASTRTRTPAMTCTAESQPVRLPPPPPFVHSGLQASMVVHGRPALPLLAAAVKLTLVTGENLTVGSTVTLPAESVAPGR